MPKVAPSAARAVRRTNRLPELVREGEITFEDFVEIIPDGQKADLLDGVIYVASPENTDANRIDVWLTVLIAGYVEAKQLGQVFVSRVAYRITDKRGPEPDLGFLPKDREGARRRGFIAGPPALAIEIVSPDSVYRDYVQKRRIYEDAGVEEYWIIDPDQKRATFLCRHKGRYRERKPVKHIWRSEVLPGFWLDVRWLWSTKRPRAFDVLSNLLGD